MTFSSFRIYHKIIIVFLLKIFHRGDAGFPGDEGPKGFVGPKGNQGNFQSKLLTEQDLF